MTPARSLLRRTACLGLALLLAPPLEEVTRAAPPPPPAAGPAPAAPPPAPAPAPRPPLGSGKRRPKPAPKGAPAAPVPIGAPGAEPELPPLERAATDCPDKIPPSKRFKLEFRGEVELKDLIAWASATLCRPVLVPTTIRQQKVQIYAPATTTLPEAYRIFLAALNTMGLTVQPEGRALVIIETSRAKESTVPFIGTDGHVPNDASYVTKVIRVHDVSPDEVAGVLQKLKSKDGDIVPYGPTGMLIITDVAENVRRMEEIVRLVDQPMGSEKIWAIKLRNTRATDMAQLLEKIFQPKQQGGAAPGARPRPGGASAVATPSLAGEMGEAGSVSLIIPDEKVNMLIIVANERTYRRMLQLVLRLEQSAAGPVDAASDRVHIYPLANANAEDISTTLSGLGVGITTARGRSSTGGPAAASTSSSGAQGAAGGLFEGEVKVAADKPTNSLVIVAGGKDYYTLRDIIRRLDISRKQVFIEATILEVSLDKARKLGTAWHGGAASDSLSPTPGTSLIFGGSEPNSATNSLLFSPAALSGLAAGIRGPNIPGAAELLGLNPGTTVPSFGVFLMALQNNNDVNVVSLPHILTTDNEKANIEVGQNLPFPGLLGGGLPGLAGAAAGAAGAAGGFAGFGTSVQRQDVSLKLEITPHIGNEDMVRLEIDNEISDVSSPNYNGLGPATNKRKVKTQITVRDQQPVVLGGLIKDRVSESVDKVPLLGDIPIIGYLFKSTNKSVTKQNLLIILTPYIIRDPQDLRRIFERKVQERRDFLEHYSNFRDDRDFEAAINYRHKRGLLEEINRSAVEIEREAADLRSAEQNARARFDEGPVDITPPRPPAPPPEPGLPPPPRTQVLPPTPPPVFAPLGTPGDEGEAVPAKVKGPARPGAATSPAAGGRELP